MDCIRIRRGDYGFELVFRLYRLDGSDVVVPDNADIRLEIYDTRWSLVKTITGRKTGESTVAIPIGSSITDDMDGRYYAVLVLEVPDQYRESSEPICLEVW